MVKYVRLWSCACCGERVHFDSKTGALSCGCGTSYPKRIDLRGYKREKTYGAMSEHKKEKALRKAMGEPIKETKTEFKF